jgi:hypothetical protein
VAVDFPLFLSETKHNWSLPAVETHVDSATHDMAVHCGAGVKPKLDLYLFVLLFVVEMTV